MFSTLSLDMYQSAGVGVCALLLGLFLTKKVPFLKRMCIPSPVSGGLLVSALTLVLYYAFHLECSFDATIKDIAMMIFFTSVGYQSNLRMVKEGGKPLAVLVVLVAILIFMQNLIGTSIARGLGVGPLVGMATGSIPMCGGHGTAGGFASVLEGMGLGSAPSLTMAAATFGLVAGSMLGGPLSEMLIRKHSLAVAQAPPRNIVEEMDITKASPESKQEHPKSEEGEFHLYTQAVYQLFLAMALGTLFSWLLSFTGITFPTYFGSLIAASLIRNICESRPGWSKSLSIGKIVSLGDICLSLFLGMAMSSLKLWELAGLALPLLTILLSQVLFIALFAYFVAFPFLGKDYDAAVLVGGLCGFGLGATPNAMANMSAVCYKYRYAVKPFFIVPIVGAMFVDIINTGIISIFLKFIGN